MPTSRAAGPVAFGRALGGGARPAPSSSVSGPTRCEPQRSCSFAARSPVSYVPIETCSAPWYEVSSCAAERDEGGRDRGDQHASPRASASGRDERRARLALALAGDEGDGDRRAARRASAPRAGARLTSGSTANASASRSGPRTNGMVTRGAEPRLRPRRGLDRPVGQPNGGAPGRRPVHEHAVLEGHAAEPELLHDAEGSASDPGHGCARRRRSTRSAATCVSPRDAEAPAGGAPPPHGSSYARSSTATTGMTSRTDDEVKASSAARRRPSRIARPPRSRSRAPPRARGARRASRPRGSRARAQVSRRTAPSRHQTFVTGPSSTVPSRSTRTASSAPRRFASASAATCVA